MPGDCELEHLNNPLLCTSADIQSTTSLNLADHIKDVRRGDRVYEFLPDGRENVPFQS